MRCFVAVDLSPEVRSAVVRLQAGVRSAAPAADVRWTDAAGLHLTLRFLGEVPDADVPAVAAALGTAVAGMPPLALAAGGPGGFPSLARPRVLWVGLSAGAAEVARLAAAVDAALVPLGFPPEARPFHAHVTLGRVRSSRGLTPALRALESAPALAAASWTAHDVVLYRSRLGPSGAMHAVVARVPLSAPDV